MLRKEVKDLRDLPFEDVKNSIEELHNKGDLRVPDNEPKSWFEITAQGKRRIEKEGGYCEEERKERGKQKREDRQRDEKKIKKLTIRNLKTGIFHNWIYIGLSLAAIIGWIIKGIFWLFNRA